MNYQTFVVIFVTCFVVCVSVSSAAPTDEKKEEEDEQARLDEFFKKYCNETDDKMLAKLEKCEDPQPEKMKQMEFDCVKKILKKSGKPSYKEIKTVECSDQLGPKFDDCESEGMKNMTIKEDLKKIAIQILSCGFDLYKIKHQ